MLKALTTAEEGMKENTTHAYKEGQKPESSLKKEGSKSTGSKCIVIVHLRLSLRFRRPISHLRNTPLILYYNSNKNTKSGIFLGRNFLLLVPREEPSPFRSFPPTTGTNPNPTEEESDRNRGDGWTIRKEDCVDLYPTHAKPSTVPLFQNPLVLFPPCPSLPSFLESPL